MTIKFNNQITIKNLVYHSVKSNWLLPVTSRIKVPFNMAIFSSHNKMTQPSCRCLLRASPNAQHYVRLSHVLCFGQGSMLQV